MLDRREAGWYNSKSDGAQALSNYGPLAQLVRASGS